jgi:predicted acyltransferase
VNPYTAPMDRMTRFRSLDALRGLAILGMAWSGMLPDSLPSWMYHAQLPPPAHTYSPEIFGLTWVDLIFPMFLFSMGAAIPIAVSNRLQKGESTRSILIWLATRALLLASFAIFSQHLRPFAWSSSPDLTTWLVSIGGFILLILMYGHSTRWAGSKPFLLARAVAWVAAILLVATHVYPDNGLKGFANYRNDVILMVLADVAFAGGVVWMLTRCRPILRMAATVAVMLIFLGQSADGSVAKQIWEWTPQQYVTFHHWNDSRFFPIVYHFEYLKYLLIVLPGTLCGDLILKAMKPDNSSPNQWPKLRLWCIVVLGVVTALLACAGLTDRATVATFWEEGALCVALFAFARGAQSPAEQLVSGMVRHGSVLLMIGLLAEPIGGGIRKDSATLSYFLTTGGLSFLLLAALEVGIDLLGDPGILEFSWLTGMNPMLAYAAITNLVAGVSGLTGYSARVSSGFLASEPWALAVLDGGMRTMIVGLAASAFTRWRYFLRT